jgi:putative hemolysin
MTEIGLLSARRARLEVESKRGSSRARAALELSGNPDRFLSTIQIGITLTGVLTGLLSGEAFASGLAVLLCEVPVLEPYALGISRGIIVVSVTYVTLVLGELVPKRIGLSFAERVAMLMSRPMLILSSITSPFVWLLSKSTSLVIYLLGLSRTERTKVTEEEIRAVVREGFDGGAVAEVEQDIVERVFTLGDRNVGSIMTHRSDVVWLDLHATPEVIRDRLSVHLFNVYPVASEKFDNIVGIVYLKDLYGRTSAADFSLSQVLRPAQFVPENQSVYRALEQFKKARVKYGLVTDEFGGIQGIVTLKDIMEALIGQMPDVDEELAIRPRGDGSCIVDGQYSFYNFLEYFDMEDLYAEYDYNTLSGLILELLEHVPKEGETLSWQGFLFEIIDMDRARIDKVLVKRPT